MCVNSTLTSMVQEASGKLPSQRRRQKMSGKWKVVDGSMVSVCDTYYKLLERSAYS